MEKEKHIDIKIRRKYEKSNDFKRYYVTGAIGGFKNQYDFRLSFFNVNSNDFLMQTQKFKVQNLSEDEISTKISKMEMPHEIQCELIMTEQAVKELYNFLGKELKNYEERKETPQKKYKKNISSKAI